HIGLRNEPQRGGARLLGECRPRERPMAQAPVPRSKARRVVFSFDMLRHPPPALASQPLGDSVATCTQGRNASTASRAENILPALWPTPGSSTSRQLKVQPCCRARDCAAAKALRPRARRVAPCSLASSVSLRFLLPVSSSPRK